MKYCAIASGSNGNCYYIAKGDTAILVDAGINNKHIHLRMHNLGIIPTQIKAVFITHEHTDHIRGLSVFVKKSIKFNQRIRFPFKQSPSFHSLTPLY